jgi:phenylalanyl-tRNA synthetase beta chain
VRIVVSWLRELSPTDLSAEELAELLTARGAEVEDILRPWQGLSGVVAARVLEVRDHPNSDKLCLARVSTGAGEREVVVGVRNMRPGDLVPLAGPGASVPALDEPLTAREIRGVVSDGMLCSAMELAVAPSHEGILVLPPSVSPGDDVGEALGLRDAVLDIEVTPNRPDFLSVLGVAREVAAATGTPLVLPDAAVEEADEKAGEVATVEIRDPERCPRYLARILRDVRHVPSPPDVQARLTASGMRPISAAVDATNYAMLEIGQPLHPFDLSLLRGPGIVVRRAAEGEDLTTLDGVERAFTGDDLLIADVERPVAVAGVMGGAVAEVSEATTEILLESASFERRGIQRTRRRIGLSTEASMRFERGVDPEAVPIAADRASALIARWCDAQVLAGSIEAGAAPERRRVAVRPSRASKLLGDEVSSDEARSVFDRLGMAHEGAADSITVEVPGYRVDIEREVDLIEEIARVRGYDRVESSLPAVRGAGSLPESYAFLGRVRDAARRAGLREIVSPSFSSAEALDLTGDRDAVVVANPLTADEGYLRARLLPGVLGAVASNQARGATTVCLFEVGSAFRLDEGEPRERDVLAFALAGPASETWAEPERPLDFFDAKGALEAILRDLGIPGWAVGDTVPGDLLHPGRSAFVQIGGQRVGVLGELHPGAAERLGLGGRVAVAELEVEELRSASRADAAAVSVSRFPPVRRDLAFIVERSTPAAAVLAAITDAGGELLDGGRLFDVYVGDAVPEGSKSLAFAVDFRAPDRTLTDDEVEPVIDAIVRRIEADFAGVLRSR